MNRLKKKRLFACSTEYTIFNALNLELNKSNKNKKKTDIAIFTRSKKITKISKLISKSNIFDKIYQFYFINNMNFFFLTLIILLPKLAINFFLRKNGSCVMKSNVYDEIISQSLLYAIIFRKFNKDAKIYLIDEGISAYTGRTASNRKRSKNFLFFNKYILKVDLKNLISSYYLYKPSMYRGDHIKITPLPQLKRDNYKIYDKIFSFNNCNNYNLSPFIYLGAAFFGIRDLLTNPNKASPNFENKCRLILDKLFSSLTRSSFLYRKHPLEEVNLENNNQNFKFDLSENIWELECQNKIDNNHVIVSFFSTGSFSPKILYDKEPYVIFLYKLLDEDFLNADNVVLNFKSTYKKPEKVIVPESLEHLSDTLKNLEYNKF